MSFWNLASVEPKRSFRYKITFGGNLGGVPNTSQATIFASDVSKPSFKVSSTAYQYLNHKFNYPGRVEWEDISITFTDAGGSAGMLDITRMLMASLKEGGYQIPENTADLKTLSKNAMNNQVGKDLTIEQLNAGGLAIERWKVYNAFFTDVAFSGLKYEGDELSNAKVTVKYDYAKLEVLAAPGGAIEQTLPK